MAALRGRIEILAEKINDFSVISITFPNYDKIIIFPRTKKMISENGIAHNNVEVKIIECRIGRKLLIEVNGHEEPVSELDIFKIKVKK